MIEGTEEDDMLEKHNCLWWWRDNEIQAFEPFKQLTERSAFLYEVAGRVNGVFEFGKPWSSLSANQWEILRMRWPMKRIPRPLSALTDTEARAGDQKWPFNTTTAGHLLFANLDYTNASILEAFKRWLAAHRKAFGKGDGRTLKKGRQLSWRPVELMDLRRFKKQTLNDAERSQVSAAVRLLKASDRTTV